jgi:hypothetical protein
MKGRKFFQRAHGIALKINERLLKDLAPSYSDVGSSVEFSMLHDAQKTGLKKYVEAADKKTTKARAIEKFLMVQDDLRRTMSTFQAPTLNPKHSSLWGVKDWDNLALLRARQLVYQILGASPETDEWYARCGHGPGSTLGHPYSDRSLSAKFLIPMDMTSKCEPIFLDYFDWCRPLQVAYHMAYPTMDWSRGFSPYVEVVQGNKLTTVPKTNEIDRTMASEPTGNMFLQQGLGRLMADRLVDFGVDFRTHQELHRQLAFIASITGSNATIDWSSASDTVGVELVEWLLPHKWWLAVDAVRCEHTLVRGSWHENACFATMGNATTFPIETIVFYALGVAVADLSRHKSRSLIPEWDSIRGVVSVFGDDCILPVTYASDFLRLAKSLGFRPNLEKSFWRGHFRESCGGDYFAGRNVRPLFIEAPTSARREDMLAWMYNVANRVIRMAKKVFGPLCYVYRSTAVHYVLEELSRYNRRILIVPDNLPDDAGLKTNGDGDRLTRYLTRPVQKVSIDKHGTVRFRALVPKVLPSRERIRPFYLWVTLMRTPEVLWKYNLRCPEFLAHRSDELTGDCGFVVKTTTSCSWDVT